MSNPNLDPLDELERQADEFEARLLELAQTMGPSQLVVMVGATKQIINMLAIPDRPAAWASLRTLADLMEAAHER